MPNQASPEVAVPSPHNWSTTDEEEINRRRARAQAEEFRISNSNPRHPILSNFRVRSGSGLPSRNDTRESTITHSTFPCCLPKPNQDRPTTRGCHNYAT